MQQEGRSTRTESLYNLFSLAKDERFSTRILRLQEQKRPRSVFVDEEEQSWNLWSCIVEAEEEGEDENLYKPEYACDREAAPIQTIRLIDLAEENRVWIVIIVHGGYFSGGVFVNGQATVHKSCHRYVNRKKNGGRQSNKDKKVNNGRRPQSAGASIRRFNEEKHRNEIKDDANKIFIHAPGPQNKKLLFYEGSPLLRYQGKVRNIPFTTIKPIFSEVQAACEQLSSLSTLEELTQEEEGTPKDQTGQVVENNPSINK